VTIHEESLALGFVLGAVVTIVVDRFVLVPLAKLMERAERRWHGRLRTR
jgi:hypothetical protein